MKRGPRSFGVGWLLAILLLVTVILWWSSWNPSYPTLPDGGGNDDWTPFERVFNGTAMVLVPAGSFEMGSSEEQIDFALELCGDSCKREWFEDEAPTSIQRFDNPFWIDKTEVTRGAYKDCVFAGECTSTPDNQYSTTENQPINQVTWYQAAAYCKWREARLSTEAEWEYAARGPDNLVYPWGNEFDEKKAHYSQNSGNRTANVGNYSSGVSWVGALDMSGNLWEWTGSLYRNYPYVSNDRRNLIGNEQDVSWLIALRGGSFRFSSGFVRAANRNSNSAGVVDNNNGFRCVRPCVSAVSQLFTDNWVV